MKIFWDNYLKMPTGLGFVFIFLITFSLLLTGVNFLKKYGCYKKTLIMEVKSQYSFWTGCMVEIDGKWQPFNEYNTINLNK